MINRKLKSSIKDYHYTKIKVPWPNILKATKRIIKTVAMKAAYCKFLKSFLAEIKICPMKEFNKI